MHTQGIWSKWKAAVAVAVVEEIAHAKNNHDTAWKIGSSISLNVPITFQPLPPSNWLTSSPKPPIPSIASFRLCSCLLLPVFLTIAHLERTRILSLSLYVSPYLYIDFNFILLHSIFSLLFCCSLKRSRPHARSFFFHVYTNQSINQSINQNLSWYYMQCEYFVCCCVRSISNYSITKKIYET